MIGYKLKIYNGIRFFDLDISEKMVGFCIGEFSPTRTYRGHVKNDKKSKR